MMINVRLSPTHSRNSESNAGLDVPEGLSLLKHQVDTYLAIKNRSADIVLHTGMTGDGKSLAGQLRMLDDPSHRIIGQYPTNELIADQYRNFKTTQDLWRKTLQTVELNAHELDKHSMAEAVRRQVSLRALLRHADLLLTNPDIMHYIFEGRYITGQQNPFYIIEQLATEYQQITYDEFHLFDQQQVSAILAQIVFLYHYRGKDSPTFLLQSATPDPLLKEAFERAGLTVHPIEGEYLHQEGVAPDGYRTILQGVDLTIVPGSPDDWLLENADAVLRPALQSGHTRIAGLFNSVWRTLALRDQLAEILREFQVLPNTGLTPRSVRDASHQADVVLGTTTVDVGVDLKINFLVFEAYDAASFKQRLGRLGRHANFTDSHGSQKEFASFRAVACVPQWIYSRFEEEELQPEMNREEFFKIVEKVMPRREYVQAYNQKWGWFPAYHLCYRLGKPIVKAQHGDIQGTTAHALGQALGVNFNDQDRRYAARYKQITHEQRQIHEALETFRGGSPFTALLVLDHYQGSERYQFYDLLNILRRVEFEILDSKQVKEAALQAGLTEQHFHRNRPIVALRQAGVLSRARRLTFTMDSQEWYSQLDALTHKVAAVEALNLEITPALSLGDVVQNISRRKVAARIELGISADEARRLCKLGLFFPLYDFRTFDNRNGCIALGREALLLDAALTYRRNPNESLIL